MASASRKRSERSAGSTPAKARPSKPPGAGRAVTKLAAKVPPAAGGAASGPVLTFDSAREWEHWLSQHDGDQQGAWLRFKRKGGEAPTFTPREAVEVALCHGWIDGLARSESASWWRLRFTPRRKRSIWSQINRERAQTLITSGRMKASGLAEIKRAKADGRWEAAYAPFSRAAVPPDLQEALDAAPRAKAFFATLDGQNRYAVLFRLHQAKRPETRARRIGQFVDMLATGRKIHP